MTCKIPLLSVSLLLTLGLAGCGPAGTGADTAPVAEAPAAAPASPPADSAPAASTSGEAPAAAGGAAVPVMVGGEPELDACSTAAIQGEGKTAVLAGPGTEHATVAELANDQLVYVCDPGEAHWYVGIVWSTDTSVDCGLSSPIAQRQAYNGSCQSGWVSLAALKQLAG